jgi:hypothetical protein
MTLNCYTCAKCSFGKDVNAYCVSDDGVKHLVLELALYDSFGAFKSALLHECGLTCSQYLRRVKPKRVQPFFYGLRFRWELLKVKFPKKKVLPKPSEV